MSFLPDSKIMLMDLIQPHRLDHNHWSAELHICLLKRPKIKPLRSTCSFSIKNRWEVSSKKTRFGLCAQTGQRGKIFEMRGSCVVQVAFGMYGTHTPIYVWIKMHKGNYIILISVKGPFINDIADIAKKPCTECMNKWFLLLYL